jgi:outer membrane protein TolC
MSVSAEAVLNALRLRPRAASVPTAASGKRPEVQVDEQRLYQIVRNARPEVKAALLQIESDEKSVQPARRQYWPDVTLGASWGNTFARCDEPGRMNPPPGDGKDVYSVTVGVNIPVDASLGHRPYPRSLALGVIARRFRHRRTR